MKIRSFGLDVPGCIEAAAGYIQQQMIISGVRGNQEYFWIYMFLKS